MNLDNHRPKRLDLNTKKFTGAAKEDVEDWLFTIYQGFIGIRIEECDKHILANSSWKEFENELKNTFRQKDKEQRARFELVNLKHKEFRIKEFITKFLTLTNAISSITEDEKLSSAIPLAVQLESRFKTEEVNFIKPSRPKFNKNYGKNVTQYSNIKTKYNPKTYVGKEANRQNNRYINYNQKYSEKLKRSNIVCSRCKQTGHYANNCKKNLTKVNSVGVNDQDKVFMISLNPPKPKCIPTVKGKINGIELKIGLDCGATTSTMNHMTAVRNNIKIHKSSHKIKTATGMISEASGKTSNLEVEIGGRKHELEFIVFDHNDHDVLLGMDWFELTGCGIFPSKGILQFPDEEELNSNQFDSPYSNLLLTEINDEFEQQYSWDTSYDTIKPVIELNQKDAKLFGKVKKEVLSVIANSIDELCECATYKHKIRLADTNTPPIYSPPYRKSEAERQFLKEEIDKMLKAKQVRSKGILKSYFEKFNLKYGAETVSKKLFMFGKLKQQIFGNGYHCMMKKHVLKTSESFFGSKFESIRTENMELNREECLQMVYTRKCNHNLMDCDGEYCSYSSNPVAEYSWMEEKNIISYSCSTSPKLITAQPPDEHLFNKNCKVSDKFCLLHDSIIVWDNTIFHECPLYLISEENFLITHSKDILLSNTSIGLQIT
ncbi:unnamed protein product, partial [Brachionus calyciflorus]